MTFDLSARLRRVARDHAEVPFIQIDGATITYKSVFDAADRLANALDRIDPDRHPVAILENRSIGAYVGVFAALLSERPYVPVNPKFPDERRRSLLHRGGCRVGVGSGVVAPTGHALAVNPDAIVRHADVAATLPGDLSGRIAYVMFTSGTTGDPKGVIVTRDNLSAYLDAFERIATVPAGSRCSQLFDLSFDLSVHDMLVTANAGATLVVGNDRDMMDPVAFAAREALTCWFSVPSVAAMAKRFRRLVPDALPDLRLSLFCGEALPAGLAADWAKAAPASRILNVYGPTEATIAITAYDVSQDGLPVDEPVVPIGHDYPGSETIIVDDADRPVPPGVEGELLLGGPQVSGGYLNNPAANAAKFIDMTFPDRRSRRWYRSGDVAVADREGCLLYRGRSDDQVKIGGYRIEIAEVEEAIRAGLSGGDVAIAVNPPRTDRDQASLVGIIVDTEEAPADILARCRTILPDYMVPAKLVGVDAIPLNANGKVDRRAIRDLVAGPAAA